MKKLFIIVVLSLSVSYVNAQRKGSIASNSTITTVRNYFSENISFLDDIEGIYDVSMTPYFSGGNLLSGERSWGGKECSTSAFIWKERSGELYLWVIDAKGIPFIQLMTITPLGSTGVYRISGHYNEDYSHFGNSGRLTFDFSKRIVYDKRGFSLSFSGNDGFHKVVVDMSFVKTFPDAAIIAKKRQEDALPKEWSGTGFALNNGYVVTNYHVVEDAKTIKVSGINGNFYTSYTAIVVATDKVNDLAIIKISDNGFNGFGQLPYSVKMQMAEVGDDVFVLGYPLTQTMGNEIKLTNGIISSRTGFQGNPSLYQMSAPIQPGNSGGPMFDGKGNVIGIVCAHHSGAENVGYAIKTSYLKSLAESASLYNIFPSTNSVSTLSLSGQVKKLRNFVYKIDCSRHENFRSNSSSNTKSSHTPRFTARIGSNFYPSVTKCPSELTVTRVSTSTTCTVVEILSKHDEYAWCSIDSNTYISANGTQYKLVRAEGISISPQVTYYNGYNITFRLYFPPIPSSTTQIDLIEPGSSSWKLYGIQL